uniref:BED-type domain-containing protein n=1 Tax=Periophthalmus magnuspinnatus TaxID=409849 RepID=A0A3B3ZVN8_9GOBI
MPEKMFQPHYSLKADITAHFGFKVRERGSGMDKSCAICTHCQTTIKYSGNTTNLRVHLQRHHLDKLVLPPPKKSLDPKQRTLESQISRLASNCPHALKITDTIVHYICQGLCPYSVVGSPGFRLMINTLDQPPRVALTCDGWTSRATESYVTITSHFINEHWELISNVLQTRAMHESHTGTNIAELLSAALEEWDIASKNPAIVTDNAANMSIAVELTGMLHFKCFAHTLNLSSKRALKLPVVARLLGRVRRISNFFRRSTTASHVLSQKQKLLRLPEHKLIIDVVTRWNSAHDMLQRFLEQQPAISAALLSSEVRKTEKEVCTLSESDITSAEDIVDAMKPMKVATLVMSKESTPTLSVVAPLHAQLIHDLQESPSDSTLVKEIKAAICEDLSKRYKDEHKETMYLCSAPDPQFKALPFLPDHQQDLHEKVDLEIMTEVMPVEQDDSEEVKKHNCAAGPPPKRTKDMYSLADLLGPTYCAGTAARQRTTQDHAEEEVTRYKEAPALSLSEGNPLSWWKKHQNEYPLMSQLAKMYMCIPETSVSSECVFLTAGDTVREVHSTCVDILDYLKFTFSHFYKGRGSFWNYAISVHRGPSGSGRLLGINK